MQLDRPYDEIPSALTSGRLQGFSLPDLLWSLCRGGVTGVLRLTRDEIAKAVYIEEGRIVFATSGDPDDRLGERFLRRGLITVEQLEQAVSRLSGGKRLGTLLVEAGHLEANELVAGVLGQVEGIVFDLFDWEDGDYRFDPGPLPTAELIKLDMKTGELLLRGIRQMGAFSRIRRSVGAMQKTYGVTEHWHELLEGVALTPAERSLVERLADGDATVEELCQEVFLSNFELYQTMWALKVLGAVDERDEPWMAPSDVTQRGSLAQVDFTELLVRLARAGETGVLYVSRNQGERSFHISGGRCVFATSDDADDSLLSYLLRRGVISLRDREETAKRLLSNKRVGTILRELGVIDEKDLGRVVREQLSEIVYDTFRWTDAEYAFVPGALPTVEEITLEEDLDALVARGIRRVASWSRVWHGCGGLDVTLELKPSYLSVLDAMGAGPEEWEVIATLKAPRTPRQICRALRFGDFRVCQILWAMRALGGVEVVADQDEQGSAEGTLATVDAKEVRPLPEDRALEESIVSMEGAFEDAPLGVEGAHETRAVDVEGHAIEVETAEPSIAVEVEPQLSHDRSGIENEPCGAETGPVEALAVEVAVEVEARPEPSPEATQAVSQETLEAAMRGPLAQHEHGETAQPDATQVIPRELVEAAVMRAESGLSPQWASGSRDEHPATDDWDPPQDLEQVISRFNAAQRVVYRTVRAEVGAGAVNFIRSCCAQVGGVDGDAVAGVDIQADGSWDAAGLRSAVHALRLEDPWVRYQRLIDREIDLLRQFIGESRVVDLQREVAMVERSDAIR